MDAIEFVKQLKRMDKSVIRKYSVFNDSPEDVVAEVEEWVKMNPIKARQSVFLEQYPNVKLDTNGLIDIPPCRMDPGKYPLNGKDCYKFRSCGDCRREFWMQEVE